MNLEEMTVIFQKFQDVVKNAKESYEDRKVT